MNIGRAENKQDTALTQVPIIAAKERIKVNMRNILAKKFSNSIWGQGFIFDTDNEKIKKAFNSIDRTNDLLTLFSFVEREISVNGRSILVIDKTKDGKFVINLANPHFFSGIGMAIVTPELAVFYQRFVIGQSNYIVKSTYDKVKCVNELYGGEGQELIVLDATAKLAEIGLVPVWHHNLGFVPVVQITNIPIRQYQFNNEQFQELADWYYAQNFETQMFDAFINLQKEIWYLHSRIGVENAPQDFIQKLKASMNSIGGSLSMDYQSLFDDVLIETEMGAKITFMPGQGDFSKYADLMNSTMDMYFKFASTSRFSEGGGAQKTVAETGNARSDLIESINQKMLLRERSYTTLLRQLFCAMSVMGWDDDDDFTFKINGNLVEDMTTKIDNLIKEVQIGAK
ncbi:MAG: phage portal protein, partial [Metamycoplasmataceae bacterium]